MREKPFAVQPASSPSALSENSAAPSAVTVMRVGREALLGHAAVRLVAEAQVDLLARVGVQRVRRASCTRPTCRSAPACRCASRGIGLAVGRAVDRRPVGAAVGRDLGVEVVVVRPRCPTSRRESATALDLPVRSTERVRVFSRSSPLPLHHCLAPSAGLTTVGGDRLLRAARRRAPAGAWCCTPRRPACGSDFVAGLAPCRSSSQPSWSLSQAVMSPGRSPMASLPVPSQEPDDIRVQKPVEFSPLPVVS